jgi:hypothetical protein
MGFSPSHYIGLLQDRADRWADLLYGVFWYENLIRCALFDR